MNTLTIIGTFFLVLAVVFGFAARGDYMAAQRRWSPRAKTRRRIAVVFGVVGLGLILFHLLERG